MLGWGGFWVLTLIWGSLFLFSRIGVESIDPTHITFIRLGTAAVGMNLIIIFRRLPIPHDPKILFHLIINGIGGLMIPIFLLNIGIQSVESGVTSVLQASSAVFAALVAHFIFVDERLSLIKFVGVLISFVGVIVLTLRDSGSINGQSTLEGQVLLIASGVIYAGFTIHSRILMKRQIKPAVFSAIALLSATVFMGCIMLIQIAQGYTPPALPGSITPTALLSVVILATVHSFVAYLLYYEVVSRIGASSATMVTYTIPPVALILGIIFLNEQLDSYIIAGTTLIFAGIALTKLNVFERIHFQRFYKLFRFSQ